MKVAIAYQSCVVQVVEKHSTKSQTGDALTDVNSDVLAYMQGRRPKAE
jgi:hypothetical protein